MATDGPAVDDESIFRESTRRFWCLRLITDVRPDGLYVRLSPLQRSFRHIPGQEIDTVRVEPYAATTYSGWHWGLRRTLGGNTVYRLRGDEGVEVVLTTGDRWFIGSQRPAQLKSALEQVATYVTEMSETRV